MHLADRRGGDRALRELDEELLDRQAKLELDDLFDLLERKRRDVVLELAKLEDDVRRHDVRPSREQLSELDEGRAELVEHLAEVLPALGALAVARRRPAAPREEICQPVALEEVAEPVLDGDLGDLRDPAQVARRRSPSGHGLSVARRVRVPARLRALRAGSSTPAASARRSRCSSWATRSSSSS